MMPEKEKAKNRGGRPPVTIDSPLTRKQELFVRELVSKDGQITKTEAAVNAGYPAKSATAAASRLTNPKYHPHVCKAIKLYRQELDEKYGIDYQRHLRDLKVIRDKALESGAYSAAVQAEYRRGQAQGDIYISKAEIRHGSIDSMSKDEVTKALNELKENYVRVIDVTPERDVAEGSEEESDGVGFLQDDQISDGEIIEESDTHEDGDVGTPRDS
jgi:phage terminase small subunit